MTTTATADATTGRDRALASQPLGAHDDIDDALDDSFPASDPPSWWAGADRQDRRCRR